MVGRMLVGGQKRHGFFGTFKCWRCAPELFDVLRYREYGGMGVTMVSVMRSALPKRGTRMSAARIALCKRIEMASARRLTRRSRVRCAASPSTRHPLSGPRLSSGITSEAFLGSGDITHLHIFSCKSPPLCGSTERDYRNFAATISWGLL